MTGGSRRVGSSGRVLVPRTSSSKNRSSKYPKEAALNLPTAASFAVACTLSSLPGSALLIEKPPK